MRDVLMRVQNGHRTVLESLPDEAFMRLARELRGAVINREEVVLVEPDLDYFQKLAAAQGDGADRAFFAALKATYPESVWPVYVEQQTDAGGCTRFGSMSLVKTYRAWADFQRKYPGRYPGAASREVDAVLKHLTESTCACGNIATVEQELQQFLGSVPPSSARDKVDQRLQALRARQSGIRTSCVAG